MRIFVAIDFSNELKDEISGLQKVIKPKASSGRWKHRDNFHLTLKFLGEVNEELIGDIDIRLKEAVAGMTAFNLEISEIGNFPGRENIRVLWLGLDGELDKLRSLQYAIEKQLEKCGFAMEKRSYKPHVTIGQELCFSCDFEEIKGMVSGISFPKIHADRIHLVKSEQIGNRRIYTSIRKYMF